MEEFENEITPEIKFFRLVTGEDIIAEGVYSPPSSTNLTGYWEIFNPLKVVYLNDGKGIFQISLMQWVFPKIAEHQAFRIYDHNILLESDASSSMTAHYMRSMDIFTKRDDNDSYRDAMLADDDMDIEPSMSEEDVKKYLASLWESGPKKGKRRKLN